MNGPHPQPFSLDAAGELFRNIVRTAKSPLNPPTLGDFEFMLPQSWGLGGRKKPSELTICPIVKFASSISLGEKGARIKVPLLRELPCTHKSVVQ